MALAAAKWRSIGMATDVAVNRARRDFEGTPDRQKPGKFKDKFWHVSQPAAAGAQERGDLLEL